MLAQHIRSIEHGRAAVVALGGGAFLSPANRDLAAGNGVSRLAGFAISTASSAAWRRPPTGRWRAIREIGGSVR